MKVLQIQSPGNFEILEVDPPIPGPGQVLLKVLAVTTCPHWDMHIFDGQPMFPGVPLSYPYTLGQPGHEGCGEVVCCGEGVTEYHPGQRVCMWRDSGHHVQGCYAEYVVKEAWELVPIPDDARPENWAPLELAMCVSVHIQLAEKLDLVQGRSVAVSGLGPAGLICIQLLRCAGAASVAGIDPNPMRRRLALQAGADRVIDPSDPSFASLPKRGQKGCFDTAFDCAGNPKAVSAAMKMTSSLVVLFAVQREPYIFTPDLWGGLMLAGAQPHTREGALYARGRILTGGLDLSLIVSEVMPLGDYSRAIGLLKSQQALKVAFIP